jgi:hypothetical protein
LSTVLASNFEWLNARRSSRPTPQLRWQEANLGNKTRIFLNGNVDAVDATSKKRLRHIAIDSDGRIARRTISSCNLIASRRAPRIISSACWVSTLPSNGQSVSENTESTPGMQSTFFGGIDVIAMMRESIPELRRPEITIVQSLGAGLSVPSEPQPIGEPRSIEFESPGPRTFTLSTNDVPAVEVTFSGAKGTTTIRKNEWLFVSFGTITCQLMPNAFLAHASNGRIFEGSMTCLPIVDGASPQSWNYLVRLDRIGDEMRLELCQLSCGMRSEYANRPLPILGENEELVLAAPRGNLILKVSDRIPIVAADIEARFLLRTFPELA